MSLDFVGHNVHGACTLFWSKPRFLAHQLHGPACLPAYLPRPLSLEPSWQRHRIHRRANVPLAGCSIARPLTSKRAAQLGASHAQSYRKVTSFSSWGDRGRLKTWLMMIRGGFSYVLSCLCRGVGCCIAS